jgi:hypothetical protein
MTPGELSEIKAELQKLSREVAELSTAILGIKGSERRGMAGEVRHLFNVTDDHEKRIGAIEVTCKERQGRETGAASSTDDSSVTIGKAKVRMPWWVWIVLLAMAFVGAAALALMTALGWVHP